MRFGTEEHRLYWKIMAIGFVVDLIGAFILTWGAELLTGSKNDSLLVATGFVWLAIQAARFLIMLLNLGRLYMAKEVGAFKASGEAFFTALKENGLPKPDGYLHSVDAYLSGVADDEQQDPKRRTVAACLYGVRQGTKNLGIWHSVLLDSAH